MIFLTSSMIEIHCCDPLFPLQKAILDVYVRYLIIRGKAGLGLDRLIECNAITGSYKNRLVP